MLFVIYILKAWIFYVLRQRKLIDLTVMPGGNHQWTNLVHQNDFSEFVHYVFKSSLKVMSFIDLIHYIHKKTTW